MCCDDTHLPSLHTEVNRKGVQFMWHHKFMLRLRARQMHGEPCTSLLSWCVDIMFLTSWICEINKRNLVSCQASYFIRSVGKVLFLGRLVVSKETQLTHTCVGAVPWWLTTLTFYQLALLLLVGLSILVIFRF